MQSGLAFIRQFYFEKTQALKACDFIGCEQGRSRLLCKIYVFDHSLTVVALFFRNFYKFLFDSGIAMIESFDVYLASARLRSENIHIHPPAIYLNY